MRRGLTTLSLLFIGTFALAACGGDEKDTWDAAPDKGAEPDAKPEIDWGVPQDLAEADAGEPDLAQPDGPQPDGLVIDTGPEPDVSTAGIDRCTGAQQVTLSAGKATVSGDTSTLSDEYATLKCQATGASSSTAMDGPQAYYKMSMSKDQWYRFELKPQFSAYLYVFTSTTCGELEMGTDCTSGGATGEATTYVSSGRVGVAHFKAPADGVLRFAVDSTGPTLSGAFEVTVEETTQPQNGTCAQAEKLTLVGGKASVSGYTGATLTPDEMIIDCGTTGAFDGPQAYYQFDAQAGQAYDLALTATAASGLYMYVFGDSCVEADIDADCSSGGSDGAVLTTSASTGTTRNLTFIPAATGTYTIAVDSKLGSSSGGFTLEVAEFTPPSNGVCTGAATIALSGGHGVVSASTSGVLDEFPTLACKGTGQTSTTTMDGPQLYYKFAAQQDQWYRITLDPTFTAYAYVFTKTTCAEAAIQTDCQSQGVSGEASSSVSDRKPEAIYFKAPATADVFVVVDSAAPTTFGDFTLTIDALTAAQNGTCGNAAALTFNGGKVTVQGDTSPGLTPDQFVGLKCKGSDSTYTTSALAGPQAYFKFGSKAGQWYRITLTPTFTAYMYAFTKSACTETAIATDCQSQGATGEASGSISAAIPELMHFRAATASDVYVGVDSTSATYYGTFFLDVEEIPPRANGTCANAEPLTFSGGSVSADGEVGPLLTPDEYPTLKCGKTTAFDGPQVYYRFNATVNKTYDITITAETASTLYLYVFGDSCAEADIEVDCASGGTSGTVDTTYVTRGNSRTLSFIAPSTGTFHIGVDKSSNADYGTFRLTVAEK